MSSLITGSGRVVAEPLLAFRAAFSRLHPLSAALGDEAKPADTERRSSRLGEPTNPIRVVVVEDDQLDRQLYRRALAKAAVDYEITEFAYAEDALGAIGLLRPQCILLDLNLPDSSGLQFLERLKALALPDPPAVVMLTAFDSRGLGVESLRSGATDYISKDQLDSATLERSVHRAVAEYEGRRLRGQLERAEKMAAIGRLAAGVAHEVNNPATFIMANLDLSSSMIDEATTDDGLTLDPEQAAELREMLSDCREGIERISLIVQELRSQTTAPLEGVVPTSWDEVVRSSARLLKARLTGIKDAEFHYAAAQKLNGDRNKLNQVITNLITNAIEAAGPSGRIRVSTRLTDTDAVVTVEDSGTGIPVELRERVFEPFYTTKQSKRGMGLGLALCAEYVEMHGGTIRASESTLGGAKLTVRIPLHTKLKLTTQVSMTRRKVSLPKGGRPRVLAVDDEPAILKAYQRMLKAHLDIVICESPAQALQKLRAESFDVVLCDVLMPDMDGLTLLDEAKKLQLNGLPPFVFCTGGALDDQMANRLANETAPIINKPIQADRLRDIIIDQLRSARAN